MKRLNIIGAGRLGKVIGKCLLETGNIELKGICNSNVQSAMDAVTFIGGGEPCPSIQALPPADVTLIATDDKSIAKVATKLAQSVAASSGLLFHCSGFHTSQVLRQSFNKPGFIYASCHPMRSFSAAALQSYQAFPGTLCALEGDAPAVAWLQQQVTEMKANPFIINEEDKPLYHAAGVFASNYLCALYQATSLCLSEANIPAELQSSIICSLMQGTLNNLKSLKATDKALTGPIARGDMDVVTAHLEALEFNPKLRRAYQVLGLLLGNVAALSTKQKKALNVLLEEVPLLD